MPMVGGVLKQSDIELMPMERGVLKQSDTESDVDQPGASSGSKPEDTQLTVEQAKEVFTKGRKSKFVSTEAEMQALLKPSIY